MGNIRSNKLFFLNVVAFAVVLGIWLGAGVKTLGHDDDTKAFWPSWRGPLATGVAPEGDPPLGWSESRNIRWKVEIPGRGSASPIVWGNQVYVTTAVPVGEAVSGGNLGGGTASKRGRRSRSSHRVRQFTVLAYDRTDGRLVWQRIAREERPHEAVHSENGTWASGSTVTDGKRLYAYFGSQGLYCYDLEGELIWERDFGDLQMRNQFGEGSTPALHGDTIVVVWDHQGDSFVVALDAQTGDERWRVARDEIDSWATPIIVEHNGRHQVVVGAMNRVMSYDLETGAIVWESDGLTMNPIPSPVAADGFVFLTSGYRGNNLKAVRLDDATGDISGTPAIAWTLDRDTPYVPSPLLYGDTLYLIKRNSGLLSAYDAKTGTAHYKLQRLAGISNVFASPVGAGGRIYIVGRDGTTLVIRQGATFDLLATNVLDDRFDASPAVVGNQIYLRGYRYLYAIGGAE